MKRVDRNADTFLEVISTSKNLKGLKMELIFFHKTKNTDSNDNSNQLWRAKKMKTNIKIPLTEYSFQLKLQRSMFNGISQFY